MMETPNDSTGGNGLDRRIAHLTPARQELLRLRLKLAQNQRSGQEIVSRPHGDTAARTSSAQQRLWFLNQFDTAQCQYNVPLAIHFAGSLNVEALDWSLSQIVGRHEVLRTTYPAVDGSPSLLVHPPGQFKLEVCDARTISEADFEAETLALTRAPFDLTVHQPIRARLFQRSVQAWVLVLVLHHTAFDGSSAGILLSELETFYTAFVEHKPAGLGDLPVQYADYAQWQREQIESKTFAPQIERWKQQLREAPHFLALPADRLRPPRPSYSGDTLRRMLSPDLTGQLREFSRMRGATLFMTLFAAFQVFIGRYSQQERFLIGTPVAEPRRPETEALIGFFTNTVVLSSDVSGDPTFEELLHKTRETARQAYAYSDVPFEVLIEALRPERSLSHSPLIQVMFGHLERLRQNLRLPGVETHVRPVANRTSRFDLYLNALEDPASIELQLNYSTDLFGPGSIARMLDQYAVLLQSAMETPDAKIADLGMASEAEQRRVRIEFNRTQRAYPQACGHWLFEQQAKATPDATAVSDADSRWSYTELDQRANRIAQLLCRRGVERGALVGVCLPPNAEFAAALLGIWKTGAAYLPLDASYPAERIAYLLRDSRSSAILTSRALAGKLPYTGLPEIEIEGARFLAAAELPPCDAASPDDLAYVMYTSGSTGAPNGVEIPHRAIVRLVAGSEFATLGPGQVFLQLAPVQFDASTLELWGPLLTGGRLVFYPSRVPEASVLGEWIRREGVTTLWLTSTLYNALIDEAPDALRGLEQLLIGGEALSVMHVRRGLELLEGTRLINGYGPTESTVFACCWPIPRELPERLPSIPIGSPIANTRLYILDARLRPCPIGVPGEIAIAGDGLALRYRGRAELTAARFVGSPWGERLYRTGDIGRWLDTGVVEFLGRADGQCKIRGHRIELGEIDAALAGCPGVRRAAAVVSEPSPGERELAAYVVADGAQHVTAAGLREHLARTLPAYMLPAHILFVSELPVNENGKLDVAKLPRATAPPSDPMPRGSCSPAEWQLLRMCGELLPSHPPGLQDNLFDAGLHSLLAARLTARIERAFGKRISLSRIFEFPTIERLAAFLEGGDAPVERLAINPLQPHGSLAPLFFLWAGPYLWPLAKRLGRPVLGLTEPTGLPDLTLEASAARYVQTLRNVRPHGPYALAGWCASGNAAYAVAQQLRAEGEEVALLILLDSINYAAWHAPSRPARIRRWMRRHAESLRFHWRQFSRQPAGARATYLCERVEAIGEHLHGLAWRAMYATQQRLGVDAAIAHSETHRSIFAARRYRPQPYAGRVLLVRQTERPASEAESDLGWKTVAAGKLEIESVMGGHHSMYQEPSVETLAELLRSRLADALRDR